MSKYKIYEEEICRLSKEGYTNSEISKIVKIDQRRISDLLKKNGLKANEKKYQEPSDINKKVILACVIGDGCLFKQSRSKNLRMNLAHGMKQKDYFIHKYELLKDFIKVPYTIKNELRKANNKEYTRIKFQTRVHPYFTELYEKWYENGKKVFKKEYMHEIDEMVLAFKFFDDGNRVSTSLGICLNDYDKESVLNFMDHLRERFGIESNLHARNFVYIPAKFKSKFIDIVKPYATKDVLYKIQ